MIPLQVNRAISMFSKTQSAYDTVGARVNHKWAETKGDDYTFFGKIAPATDKDLDLVEQGDILAGAIVIHVLPAVTLFYKDVTNTASKLKQTYITFKGELYRVSAESERTDDGAHRRYGALKIVERK